MLVAGSIKGNTYLSLVNGENQVLEISIPYLNQVLKYATANLITEAKRILFTQPII